MRLSGTPVSIHVRKGCGVDQTIQNTSSSDLYASVRDAFGSCRL